MKPYKASWAQDSIFYHIYPLGLCGAPTSNDSTSPPQERLRQLWDWVPHQLSLGSNALYIGPLFESSTHGYDTVDYFTVDRRLGTNQTLRELSTYWHQQEIRVILDGVFHHVGRDFWAFRDLLARGEDSAYRHWFSGVDFSRRSPYGDAFAYDGWNGHYNLVKLNLAHPEVRNHLFAAVTMWMDEFAIDGLRLDAADVMDIHFLRELAAFCRQRNPDFWLMGEVIHGDYRQWANDQTLDATTNYECYKGLYSSHNDHNYFELAYSLNRQFGPQGIYQGLSFYNFADNHDVNRVSSTLHDPAHLYPLYALLFTMPGVPSVYYGSEWGIEGSKQAGDDSPLRPSLGAPSTVTNKPHPDLASVIQQLARIRQQAPALRYGSYQQVIVNHEQFAFLRQTEQQAIIVVVNAAHNEVQLALPVTIPNADHSVDLLEPAVHMPVKNNSVQLTVPPCWCRILLINRSE